MTGRDRIFITFFASIYIYLKQLLAQGARGAEHAFPEFGGRARQDTEPRSRKAEAVGGSPKRGQERVRAVGACYGLGHSKEKLQGVYLKIFSIRAL